MRNYARIFIVLGVIAAAVALVGATTAAGTGSSSRPDVTPAKAKATKAKAPAAKGDAAQARKAVAKKASNDAGVSSSQPVNAADVTSYWTPERMKNAEPAPMGARQGGAAAKPGPTGKAAGGATGGQAKARSQKKASRVQTPADASVSSSQQVNPADIAAYWTPERMKSAQPAGMGVSGGNSGSPPASGDSAGGTAP
jgi:hypothetical protein